MQLARAASCPEVRHQGARRLLGAIDPLQERPHLLLPEPFSMFDSAPSSSASTVRPRTRPPLACSALSAKVSPDEIYTSKSFASSACKTPASPTSPESSTSTDFRNSSAFLSSPGGRHCKPVLFSVPYPAEKFAEHPGALGAFLTDLQAETLSIGGSCIGSRTVSRQASRAVSRILSPVDSAQ